MEAFRIQHFKRIYDSVPIEVEEYIAPKTFFIDDEIYKNQEAMENQYMNMQEELENQYESIQDLNHNESNSISRCSWNTQWST